jgi:lysozyme family protein
MKFLACFKLSVGHEGTLSLDPNDKGNWTGGAIGEGELKGTKYGISAASYPHLDIKNLTLDMAMGIYETDIWKWFQMDRMPEWLRYPLFDYAINTGKYEAARDLQGALGVLRDGKVGEKTIAAATKANALNVLRLLFVERAMTFALSPQDRRYGPGWFARLFDVYLSTWRTECVAT